MTSPTEYQINILPSTEQEVHTRLFGSNSTVDLINAVLWMIDMLPTERQRADARVGIMLTLRHDDEPSQ